VIAKRRTALAALLIFVTGCTESAGGLSRDYRNLNNECIDSLMMITSERRASLANTKILGKLYQEKIQTIDKRFDNWLMNQEEKDVVKDVLSSESVVILIAENKINKKRLEFEMARLKRLLDTRVKDETERRKANGDANANVDPEKVFPHLNAAASGSFIGPLQQQLDRGTKFQDLLNKIQNDKNWQKYRPPNFDQLMEDFTKRLKNQEM
jgi:hypothetical protein